MFRKDSAGPLPPSQVTRWETGQISVESAVVERYEQLLSLPRFSLSITHEVSATFLDGPVGSAGKPEVSDHVLHELLDRARNVGDMRGADWRRLTGLVRAQPNLVLHPPELWREVAQTLLDELVVSEHKSWFVRQEAMSRLLAHPASAPHMIAACVDLAEDPQNPVFIEPISLLDAANHPVANNYVLTELRTPRNNQSLQGALLAATSKLRRAHYSVTERAMLHETVQDLRRRRDRHPAIWPLLTDLAGLLTNDRVETPQESKDLAVKLATDASSRLPTATGDPDRMLAELVEEAVFSRNSDARLYAAGLIAATPYQQPVSDAVAKQLVQRATLRDELFVERGLRLLARLQATDHHVIIGRLLQDPAATAHARHSAVWAASHSAGGLHESVWRTIVRQQLHLFITRPSPLDQDILHGLVYSVGAAGHARLLAELAKHPSMPQQMRQLAHWWHARDGIRPH